MSELTSCNYCNLKRIRADHRGTGARIYVRYNAKWGLGGCNVYVIPKGIKAPKGGIKDDTPFHNEYSVSWFMELTNRCVC